MPATCSIPFLASLLNAVFIQKVLSYLFTIFYIRKLFTLRLRFFVSFYVILNVYQLHLLAPYWKKMNLDVFVNYNYKCPMNVANKLYMSYELCVYVCSQMCVFWSVLLNSIVLNHLIVVKLIWQDFWLPKCRLKSFDPLKFNWICEMHKQGTCTSNTNNQREPFRAQTTLVGD